MSRKRVVVWRTAVSTLGLMLLAALQGVEAKMGLEAGGARPMILVMLSPRMAYSIHEWPRMAGAAQAAGFDVQVFRDPRVPKPEWEAATRVDGFDALAAVEAPDAQTLQTFKTHHAMNHAPAALVKCGRVIHPAPVLGVMPDIAWTAVLRQRVGELPGCASGPIRRQGSRP